MTNSVDLEQVRIRSLRLPYVSEATPIQPLKPLSGTLSTIAPAVAMDQTPSRVSRPILDKPRIHFMLPLLAVQQETERLSQKQAELFEAEIRTDLDQLKELDEKKLELLREAAKDLASRNTWSALLNVAQYVASATSIVVGIGLVNTGAGTIPGAFLIASGGLGLLNRGATDTGAQQWIISYLVTSSELQSKLSEQIDAGLATVSLGLSIAGTLGAYHAGVLLVLGEEAVLQKALEILKCSNITLQLTSKTGEALANRRLCICQAEFKLLEAQDLQKTQEVEQDTIEVRKLTELSEAINRIMKDLIASSSK